MNSSIEIHCQGFVNNSAVNTMEVTVEQEHIDVTPRAERDPHWSAIDAAGHFHAVTKDGTYPTLSQIREHRDCDGDCEEGFQECDGWYETVYRCSICLQPVVPGTRPGRLSHIPGMKSWHAKVTGVFLPIGERVTIRLLRQRKVVAFGLAEVTKTEMDSRLGYLGACVHLVGISVLGHTTAMGNKR